MKIWLVQNCLGDFVVIAPHETGAIQRVNSVSADCEEAYVGRREFVTQIDVDDYRMHNFIIVGKVRSPSEFSNS